MFLAEGNRLFSEDNNYRNEYGSALLPEDWRTDPYWGSWLVGEWFGVLFTGICVVRGSYVIFIINDVMLSST